MNCPFLSVAEVVMMVVFVVELLAVGEKKCLSNLLPTDWSNRKMILIVEEGPA